jgi:hypothetical protein
MVDLTHENVRAGVEPSGDGVVECVLEGLFLADGGVEEVCPIDMWSLRQ